jgi:hypothetical protein
MVRVSVTPLLREHHQYNTFVRASEPTPSDVLCTCGEADWRKATFAAQWMGAGPESREKIGKEAIDDESEGHGLTPVRPVDRSRIGAVFTR